MKENRTKNIILSCMIILVIACFCVGVLIVTGVGVSLIWPFQFGQGSGSQPPPLETVSPPLPLGGETLDLDEALPEDLAELLSLIEDQVVDLRGIKPESAVTHTLISPAELQKIVMEDFFAEYSDEEAQKDVKILSALGLLPEDFDLRSFYMDLYSEQIAGFYDDESKEIFVVRGAEFGALEKVTYAHEFTHVLQDQAYGLRDGLGLSDESCEADSERCAAVQALIEGDATKTELLWFQTYASRQDYLDLMKSFDLFESPIYDSAPPFMQADLYFPYEKGLAFVEHLFEQGGYDAVDAAYQNPPVSTEQILHPEKYPSDVPIAVTLPDLSDTLGDDWYLFDQNVMGEWYTFLILNKAHEKSFQISESVAEKAAQGWGGDAYAFYLNDDDHSVVFVMDSVWDTQDDAEEFADAFTNYADARWQGADDSISGYPTWTGGSLQIVLVQDGSRTLWVMGPTEQVVYSLLNELQ